jgi:hypothetical protein
MANMNAWLSCEPDLTPKPIVDAQATNGELEGLCQLVCFLY